MDKSIRLSYGDLRLAVTTDAGYEGTLILDRTSEGRWHVSLIDFHSPDGESYKRDTRLYREPFLTFGEAEATAHEWIRARVREVERRLAATT